MRIRARCSTSDGSRAQAVDDRWSYKLSAGYLTQDPLPRPSGTIPNALQHAIPLVHQRGDIATEVRRARGLRHRRRRQRVDHRRRRRHGRHDPHRHRSFRHLERHLDDILLDPLSKGWPATSPFSRTCSTARERTCWPAGRPGNRCRSCSIPRHSTSRRRMSGPSARDTS